MEAKIYKWLPIRLLLGSVKFWEFHKYSVLMGSQLICFLKPPWKCLCWHIIYSGRWLEVSKFPWFTVSGGPQNSFGNGQATKANSEKFFLKYFQPKNVLWFQGKSKAGYILQPVDWRILKKERKSHCTLVHTQNVYLFTSF